MTDRNTATVSAQSGDRESVASIGFAIGPCSLGLVLVAATRKGVCAILLGDDRDALRAELQQRFPLADVKADDAELAESLAEVAALVDKPGRTFDRPLDVHGTAFQRRVWQALRALPSGQTVTYAELARRVDRSGSARAVAGACAANPIAVAIPCHRVVASDGRLSGYRWGIERKSILLQRER